MMNSTKMYMNSNMGPAKFLVKHKNIFFRMQSKCTPKLSLCDFEGAWIVSAFSRRRVLAFLFYFILFFKSSGYCTVHVLALFMGHE